MAADKEAKRVQAEALILFPKGTKYISYGRPTEVKGNLSALRGWENRLIVTDGYGTVYIQGVWAEKIAEEPTKLSAAIHSEEIRKGNQYLLF